MTFNSLTFLLFFGAVLALYRLPLPWWSRKALLLAASYLFYAAWDPLFVSLLLVSTGVDWVAARRIHRAAGRRRVAWLLLSLGTNLGLLGYFKYGGFLLEALVQAAAGVGLSFEPAAADIVLPMGISFYTFQTLSYTIDVYRGQMRPATSLLDYALYVTFFPQLVAGPIVRAVDFLPQCRDQKRFVPDELGLGALLFAFGLLQKTVLADAVFAPVADAVYQAPWRLDATAAWVGTLAFSGQIFCDFAGYSLCGIGVALCLGFRLPDNFRCPYAAVGLSDFWRRWHISLSTWLRDYLYIPLGGNRGGRLRVARNLMVTMLLGGLWHGASWTFVFWGGLHGGYLIVERALRAVCGGWACWRWRAVRPLLALLTFALVVVTWVPFRAADAGHMEAVLRAMAGKGGAEPWSLPPRAGLAMVVLAGMLALHWWMRDRGLPGLLRALPRGVVVAGVALVLFLIAVVREPSRGFIYFQF